MKLQNSLFNIELTHLGCLNLQSTVYGCTYISAEKILRTQKRQRLEESFTSNWDDEKLRIEEEEEEEEDIREDLWLERESSAALTLQIAILIIS